MSEPVWSPRIRRITNASSPGDRSSVVEVAVYSNQTVSDGVSTEGAMEAAQDCALSALVSEAQLSAARDGIVVRKVEAYAVPGVCEGSRSVSVIVILEIPRAPAPPIECGNWFCEHAVSGVEGLCEKCYACAAAGHLIPSGSRRCACGTSEGVEYTPKWLVHKHIPADQLFFDLRVVNAETAEGKLRDVIAALRSTGAVALPHRPESVRVEWTPEVEVRFERPFRSDLWRELRHGRFDGVNQATHIAATAIACTAGEPGFVALLAAVQLATIAAYALASTHLRRRGLKPPLVVDAARPSAVERLRAFVQSRGWRPRYTARLAALAEWAATTDHAPHAALASEAELAITTGRRARARGLLAKLAQARKAWEGQA